MTLRFPDVLAWLHCPKAAANGYRPAVPTGHPDDVRDTLRGWPSNRNALARYCPSVSAAHQFLQRTTLQVVRTSGLSAPPSASREGCKLIGDNVGLIGVIKTDDVEIRFEIPMLIRTSGVWEILILDASEEVPDQSRQDDLHTYAGWLQSCFQHVTGTWAGVRLIAPAYEREEIIEVPSQEILSISKLLSIIRPFTFIRVGPHCHRTTDTSPPKWQCPVRQAGDCRPNGTSKPA